MREMWGAPNVSSLIVDKKHRLLLERTLMITAGNGGRTWT
jgi:hypothetical protein